MTAPTANPPDQASAPKPKPSGWRIAWRIFWWATTVLGAWGLFLMLRRAPAPAVTVSAQAEQSAEQKLQTLATPPSLSREPGESRRIQLSEEELNSYLTARLALGTADPDPTVEQMRSAVRDVKVTLQGDTAGVYAVFELMGKDVTLQMQGHLHVVDGYLKFEPVSGNLGDFALPQSALSATVGRMLDNPENRETLRMPPEIKDVRVENGALVIEQK
jgi:hypothetical protein